MLCTQVRVTNVAMNTEVGEVLRSNNRVLDMFKQTYAFPNVFGCLHENDVIVNDDKYGGKL